MKNHNLIKMIFGFEKIKYLLLVLLCISIIIIRLWYTENTGMDVLSVVQSSVSAEVLFMILSPFCLWLNQILYFQNREFAVVRVKNKYKLWKVNVTVIFWNAFLIAIMSNILSLGSSILNREIALSAQVLQLYIYSFILFWLGLILIGVLQNVLIILTNNKAIAFFLVFLVFLFDSSTIKLQKVSNLFVVNDRDLIDLYSFAGRVLCLISVLIIIFWINWFFMEKKDMFRTSKKKVR
ncbi:hypothetical protein HCJ58_13180 [Listeria sp. FSL L7-1509]|uniref:ABC transporter permease n=1 Tax=Listeria immobilis TaxID=2713502 RepID=A0ABR6SYY8_9LIST|nr:hypothetical protein [Listeria immobilis]MBC1483821.1 hypothetical protein [Listeria immobilis]MBC1507910.1 hypothetical protein [Listeria immobilis]MBC1510896.1 hypothetical protein [Listeria immobilis]MBC6304165.1 hypothetical protein [Listeria immobilis]MBC6313541.1 hypothetical protein [Listeria immobilis]